MVLSIEPGTPASSLSNKVVLEPGKIVPMKLEVGVKVVAEEMAPNYPSGTVIAVVAAYLSDSTIVLH
jgi:hypothetical protein